MKRVRLKILFSSLYIFCLGSVSFSHAQANLRLSKNIIFVSPHPDDAALTFGGFIQANKGFVGQKKRITIYQPLNQSNYTVDAGGDIFTKERVRDVTSLRYKEDVDAYNILFGTWENYTFWGRVYPELTLRGHLESIQSEPVKEEGERVIYNVRQSGFDLFGAESEKYYQVVYQDFLKLLNSSDCSAFLPSAVGSVRWPQHPDHFLVREAAIQAARTLAKTKKMDEICQIFFGQDQPYTNGGLPESMIMLKDLRNRLGIGSNEEITYPINKKDKWIMLQSYKSQISPEMERVMMLRDNETFYIWPRRNYIFVRPDPTCRRKNYCDY